MDWNNQFYFDMPLHLEKARTAQRVEAFERILDYSDWFTKPISEINGYLYLLSWVVGAGKTLAPVMLACGMNLAIRQKLGSNAPRVNRILILTKEQAIRDQTARDLLRDLTGYKICTCPPKVKILSNGNHLRDRVALQNTDVCVACIQMFFTENGVPRDDLQEILSLFPMIAIDEPHFAMNQVLRIVDKAKASICFGLSGTPIKANGEILSKFVLFSTYDYDSAVTYDQSMKRISALEQNFGFQVEEINITEAELINDGEILSTKDANQLNYDKNAIPRKSVCEGVIRYVRSCDDFLQSFSSNEDLARLAEHRPRGSRPILKYAVHAMIVVDTVEVGIALCEMLNKMFENNRMLFPLEEGYRAEVVHSEIAPPQPNEFLTKETKARLKAKKLTVNHPWMEYQKTGQLSEKCARFLFVDGIGREGVSNKFCGCVGYACGVGSLVEMVQRGLGRQARDYHKVDIDGITLLTPPVRLDTIKIITHITFGNTSIIKSALRYICNMEDSLKEMPNIDQLIEGLSPNKDAELDPEAPLFDAERLAIARYMGEQKINQDPIDYRYIENRWGGNESPKKRQKIQEWVKQVLDAPEEAAKQLNHSDILEKVIIVNKESPISRPSDEDLIQFVKTHKPQHQAMLDKIELVRELFVTMYHDHAKSFHYLGHLPNTTNIDEIRKSMAASIIMSLGDCYKGPRRTVYAFVGAAVKHIVGTDAPVSIGGQYDNPQTHLLLTRPEMKKRIHGWVRRKLIKKGFCPELATIFNVKVEENKDGFPET